MVKIPLSVNFHVTERCNYHCKFCFAQYSQFSSEMPLGDAKRILFALAKAGCKKINFAGGEPTLFPNLPELIIYAKKNGLFTSLISNGTGITNSFIQKIKDCIDLIGLSIDSSSDSTELKLGRCYSKFSGKNSQYSHLKVILKAASLIHLCQIPLKINTTITPLNWNEDMQILIEKLNPIRWKVFQVLPILGVNDKFFKEFGLLRNEQFNAFLSQNRDLHPISESSNLMTDSYIMITPDGRFYQDSENCYHYSDPILEIGVQKALEQVHFSLKKFQMRNGDYFQELTQKNDPFQEVFL